MVSSLPAGDAYKIFRLWSCISRSTYDHQQTINYVYPSCFDLIEVWMRRQGGQWLAAEHQWLTVAIRRKMTCSHLAAAPCHLHLPSYFHYIHLTLHHVHGLLQHHIHNIILILPGQHHRLSPLVTLRHPCVLCSIYSTCSESWTLKTPFKWNSSIWHQHQKQLGVLILERFEVLLDFSC